MAAGVRPRSPAEQQWPQPVLYVKHPAVPAAANINVRQAPGGGIIGEIKTGTEALAVGSKGDWLKLQLEDGTTGWALARTGGMVLLCAKEAPKSASASVLGP